MKYKIKGFTEDEKADIIVRYGEWLDPANIAWVEAEYSKYETPQLKEGLKKYPFAKTLAEKIWVMEKLNDHQLHSSEYIESRIGEYPIGDFNDLTGLRILLEKWK